jgi:hypothetical protein
VKMETAGFLENLVIIYKTALSHIPVGNGLQCQAPKRDTNTEMFMVHLATLSAAQGTQYRMIRGSVYCEILRAWGKAVTCHNSSYCRGICMCVYIYIYIY